MHDLLSMTVMSAIWDRATRRDVIAAESRSDLYRYREDPTAQAVERSERLGRHKFYRGT